MFNHTRQLENSTLKELSDRLLTKYPLTDSKIPAQPAQATILRPPGFFRTAHRNYAGIYKAVKIKKTDHVAESALGIYRLQPVIGVLKSLTTVTFIDSEFF